MDTTILLSYLESKVKGFKYLTPRKEYFTCPFCFTHGSANLKDKINNKFRCLKCSKHLHYLDVIRELENKQGATDLEIINYLRSLNIKIPYTNEELFEFYQQNNFNLTPIARNSKVPFEQAWTQKEHRQLEEWRTWVTQGLNVGLQTGKVSGITVVDIDSKKVPNKLKSLITDTLVQHTGKGTHLIYKFDEEIPTTAFDFEGIHIDIKNNGGQIVIAPSQINGKQDRHFDLLIKPNTISKELKEFIIENSKKSRKIETVVTHNENSDLGAIAQGNRNNSLVKLGGILRKELNLNQTSYVLDIINRSFVKPSLPQHEVDTIVRSLDKYISDDRRELSGRVLEYIKIADFANARDIKEALQETKLNIDKALAYLVKEQLVIKKGRDYHAIKKGNWSDTLSDCIDEKVPFQVPYFNDLMEFNWTDLLILGGITGTGKTVLSMNIIKELVAQGIKPNYLYTESGSRWKKTAIALGMKDGDFNRLCCTEPTKIELEKNSVTIIDWLNIEDFALTHVVFKHLIEQLNRSHGFLIVFMQLKKNGEFFAPNLLDQYASFSSRYIYDNDSKGSTGKWYVDKIREAKSKDTPKIIPCTYDWTNRRLIPNSKFQKLIDPNTNLEEVKF